MTWSGRDPALPVFEQLGRGVCSLAWWQSKNPVGLNASSEAEAASNFTHTASSSCHALNCYCFCGIIVVPVGPMPVVWRMTSPSFANA
jgi:hypothetical protein